MNFFFFLPKILLENILVWIFREVGDGGFVSSSSPASHNVEREYMWAGWHLGTSSWGSTQSHPCLLEPCLLLGPQRGFPVHSNLCLVSHSKYKGRLSPLRLHLELIWCLWGAFSHLPGCRPLFEPSSPNPASVPPVRTVQENILVSPLVKLVQLGTWLQGLLWQPKQEIRGKACFLLECGLCVCVCTWVQGAQGKGILLRKA